MNQAIALLQTHIKPHSLLCLDENLADWPSIPSHHQLSAISNRFDIAQRHASYCHFSDWDLSAIKTPLNGLLMHISKEKAVNHFIFNQALPRLADNNGQLVVVGKKQQGCKSYAKSLQQRLGNGELTKHGDYYQFKATVTTGVDTLFNDQDYPQIRPIEQDFYSKPGQFGWQKIDAGSQLLAQHFNDLDSHKRYQLLDLGCGYGYLSAMAYRHLHIDRLCATDNNAAALLCARQNLPWQNAQVVAADVGDQLQQNFDLIVCNPPHHQGFATDTTMLKRFLHTSQKRLLSNGIALFVVNRFLALEKHSQGLFKNCQVLENNGKFKVIKLSQPY